MKTAITFINLLGALFLLWCLNPAMARLSDQQQKHPDENAGVVATDPTTTIIDGGALEDMTKTRDMIRGLHPHEDDGNRGGGGAGDGNGIGDQGAYNYGYKEAELLWFPGYYTCDNIYSFYEMDVKEQVFYLCAQKWMGQWYQDEDKMQDCQEGAKDFVLKLHGDCATMDDCSQFGYGAAASVAGNFCSTATGAPVSGEWFPRKCEKHSIAVCQVEAVREVERYIGYSTCYPFDSPETASALDSIDELHRL